MTFKSQDTIQQQAVALRQTAIEAGVPFYEVARAVGVKPTTYSAWLAGRRGAVRGPYKPNAAMRVIALTRLIGKLVKQGVLPVNLPPGREKEKRSTTILRGAIRELKKN